MAFKFLGEVRNVTIKQIDWNVSRNGILTPIAKFNFVKLSGAKISNLSLHNYGLVLKHKLKIGDVIEITRSGEVIPKFLKLINSSNNEFIIPTICPSCGEHLLIREIRLYCDNENCFSRKKNNILNYIKKIGLK